MLFSPKNHFTSISKMEKLYKRMCFEAVEEYHFTPNEIVVLMFLFNNPEFDTAKDIAYYRNISKGLVAKSVESLTKQEFLILKKDQQDRRKIHLILSEKSKDIVKRLQKCSEKFQEELMRGIPKEYLEILDKTLNKMEENLARMIKERKENYEPDKRN